jgi:NTE family protein
MHRSTHKIFRLVGHYLRRLIGASAVAVLCLVGLVGCASSIDTRTVNSPRSVLTPTVATRATADVATEQVIGLSLSGGGLRAAAFAFGVVQALADSAPGQPAVLDDLGFISSVSGGSLLAAYYGLKGADALTDFRAKVLLQDFERDMRLSVLSFPNLQRLFDGGLNDRGNLAASLNSEIFGKATFADLYLRPRPAIWINATDVYNRTPFIFTEPVFDALCSDLASFPVAEAVHASLAVPLVFAPVVLEAFADQCATPLPAWVTRFSNSAGGAAARTTQAVAQAVRNYRNPKVQRYVKLVDGGVTDNYGLSSIVVARAAAGKPYSPMSATEAVRVRRMLFLVVDAGRSPSGDWVLHRSGPSGVDMALAATDSAIDSAARISFDGFKVMLSQWQTDIQNFRCNLSPSEVAALRGAGPPDETWNCKDVKFEISLLSFSDLGAERAAQLDKIPTRLTLTTSEIDASIAAGRDAALGNAALRRYRSVRDNSSDKNSDPRPTQSITPDFP